VNVKTEAKMNVREGIFAKNMKAELEREKSRKGAIRPFTRGTPIQPLRSQGLQRSTGAIAAQAGLELLVSDPSRNILCKEIPCNNQLSPENTA
jgi:hypothetical protein